MSINPSLFHNSTSIVGTPCMMAKTSSRAREWQTKCGSHHLPNENDLPIMRTSSKFTFQEPPETEQQRRPLPDSSLTTTRQKLPTHTGRNCLVNNSDFEFCADASFCEGNSNQATRSLLYYRLHSSEVWHLPSLATQYCYGCTPTL